MNLFEFLRDREKKAPLSRQRLLPSQPDGTTPDRVYAGSDIGEVHFTGDKPEAGDFAVIVGHAPRAVALSPQTPGLGVPLFNNPCKCKCPSSAGTIFWACPIHTGPYLAVIDGDGTFRAAPRLPQLARVAGVAVDPAPPHNLYLLDDRTHLNNFVTDASPLSQRVGVSTYVLHTFQLTGGTYVWSSLVEFSDPGLPAAPAFTGELQWVTNGDAASLADPPATYPTNCMSVIDGRLVITWSLQPARYKVWDGSSLTTHTLTQNGTAYAKGLRGSIQTGITRPGKAGTRYVIAWAGQGGFSDVLNPTFYLKPAYEVLAFDENDRIIQRFPGVGRLVSPTALMVICNRIFVLQAGIYGRTEAGGGANINGTAINNSFGTPIPPALSLFDLCKSATSPRITKQAAIALDQPGFNAQPASIAALGCQAVASGAQQAGDTVTLSRFQQQGGQFSAALLRSTDAADRAQPGPASHVVTAAGLVLTGSTADPFPVPAGLFGATYTFGSDEWYTQSGGGAQPTHAPGHVYRGFGSAQAPYWTLHLPPGRVFNGVPTGRLENHPYDDYLLMPVVSAPAEPLSLGWDAGAGRYVWAVNRDSSPGLTFATNQVGGGGTGEKWSFNVFMTEVHPALLTGSGPTLSGTRAGDGSANGSGLNRSYCYFPLASGVVTPDYGGVATAAYSVAAGALRPPLTLYTQDDGGTSQPASFTLTLEGVSSPAAPASLPTGQTDPFDASLTPGVRNFNQASQYGIPTLTVQTEAGTGRQFVGITFALTIPGGFSAAGTFEYSVPFGVTLAEWLATPRYYEMMVLFFFQNNLP